MTDRLPPQDLEAERSVLGSMAIAPEAVDVALLHLEAEHFYSEANGKIFASIRDMSLKHVGVDIVTLGKELEARGQLEQIGGVPYLLQIIETVPHAAHCEYYARIVREMADRRFAIEQATAIIRAAYDRGEDTATVVAKISQSINRLVESQARENQATDLQTILIQVSERIEAGQTQGMSTSYAKLDEITTGMHPGQLIVIGARPGHCKSALACNMAHRMSADVPMVYFSLEMSCEELAQRLLSLESCMSVVEMRSGELDEGKRQQLVMANNMLFDRKLRIDAKPYQTAAQIEATARLMQRKHGIGLVIVDYLQLIQAADDRVNREQQVASISRSMKCMAKSLGIPVILLAQLNRDIEKRNDKRPRLADLRESGAIEQDADQVWLLQWPGKDADPADPDYLAPLFHVDVAKNRTGPTKRIDFELVKELMMLKEPANVYQHAIDSAMTWR